ncbi:hypothetical protein [Embleya sp. NPDC020886]|uniref:hypothetical protein n=1 Tax=Embleya sp. NPDC020886 TaxID=3363980 RepID=UPI003788DF8D
MPVEYGPWGRVHDLFRQWQRDGTRHGIFHSTVCRAHQHATGRKQGELRKEPPVGVVAEPDDHALGRSRGGFTTKPHPAIKQGQKPMPLVLTAGRPGN